MTRISSLFFGFIFTSQSLFAADEATIARFEKAYATFQETIASPLSNEHINAARQAYVIGKIIYPNDEKLAELAFNYALVEIPDNAKAARTATEEGIEILEDLYGKEALQLVEGYMALGRSYSYANNSAKANKSFKTALEIAKSGGSDALTLGSLNFRIGEIFTSAMDKKGFGYLEEAKQIYAGIGSADADQGYGRSSYLVGLFHYLLNDRKRAVNNLAEGLGFEGNENINLETRILLLRLLINMYELGGEHELADPYVYEFGKLRLDSGQAAEDPDPIVVFKVDTIREASMTDGAWVQFRFDIDEKGHVLNPIVIDQYSVSDSFIEASKTALLKFRFPIIFSEGMPVMKKDVNYIFRVQIR